jgi:hypothetical protein
MKLRSASLAVLLAAVGVVVLMLFGSPLSSSAAPGTNNEHDVNVATAKLEMLHQRAVAATRPNADDDDNNVSVSANHAVTPEKAMAIAKQVAREGGAGPQDRTYIERQTRNGRPVYAVRVGPHAMFIDADTGVVGR